MARDIASNYGSPEFSLFSLNLDIYSEEISQLSHQRSSARLYSRIRWRTGHMEAYLLEN